MGFRVTAECLDCGSTFTVDHGGGCFFHLLRCDRCGKVTPLGFDDLGELHVRYLKWFSGPCWAPSPARGHLQECAPVRPVSEDEYDSGVEAIAGKCRCGGQYRLDAPPRCPKCRSTRIEEGETILRYD